MACMRSRRWCGFHAQAAATMPLQPPALNEILVTLTDRVVVNSELPRERAHTGQLLPRLQLPGSDQEYELFSKLLMEGNVALLVERNLHDDLH